MGFEKLLIVDLSFNKFNGTLSSDYFANWSAINTHNNSVDKSKPEYIDDGSYYESVTVTNKGFEVEYVRILTIFTCIDLSNNNFHGEIPKSVGDLQSLIVLNLSSNNFEGHIPLSIGNLKQIESLDLSNNKLSGRIPQELAALTFLAYLNLSNNQLTGPIPQGTQINKMKNYVAFHYQRNVIAVMSLQVHLNMNLNLNLRVVLVGKQCLWDMDVAFLVDCWVDISLFRRYKSE
ncbi:receptor-like protein 18 [Humulus lupulus]|uniref:receptor-like protein 18 n=1 Tax=Humulus lupulus TaxID=3486 RepID=UPI002B40C4CF|nr:receptor-like protein 18 [Humulus lupulus]